MAEYTLNYNLYKPNRTDTDPVDTTLTANFQTIDDEMKKRETDIATVSEDLDTKTTVMQAQIDTIAVEGGIDPETAQARVTADGTTFNTVRDRLNFSDERLSDIAINVKSKGIIGNGATDNTTAIQDLLNIARDGGSVKLYFPKGEYHISSTMQIFKNTTIRLHSKAVFKRIGGNKFFVNGEVGNSSYSLGYEGDGNIHFKGGTYDLNTVNVPLAGPTSTTSIIDLSHAEDVSFTKTKFINGQGGHYFQIASSRNIRFKECYFGNQRYTNIGYFNSEIIQLEVANENSFPTFGGYDLTPTRDVFIENCVFDNVIRAIGSHGTTKDASGNKVFCENIIIKGCVFRSSVESALNLYGYKYCRLENNQILDSGGQGIYLADVEDSVFIGNTVEKAQWCGLFMRDSHRNKFSKNTFKDLALKLETPFAAIRVTSSNDNTWEDDTIAPTTTANYTFAWYSSDGCTGNKILSHRFIKGKSGLISGADETEKKNFQAGAGQTVLFDGDLAAVGATATLTDSVYNYSFIVVVGNDNATVDGLLTSMVIPKLAMNLTTTVKGYRMVLDDTATANRIHFSFPTENSIKVDEVFDVCHIRKVIGVI